ncbi:MAG: GIY-YIG nuclease family protein [Patescibacteria group bacterium]
MYYYVYILLLINKQFYTGFTGDLKKRIAQHNSGEVKSTRYRRPVKLIHCEIYLRESDARRREKFLKTTEGKRLLKMQIRDLFNEIRWRGGRAVEGAALEKP